MGLVAAGQTFVILIGGIDLSVPWVLNAMAVLLTTTSLGLDSRAWWVVPLVLALGVVIGAVNGLGIVFFDNVRAVTFIVYALGGLFAALAGIALTAFGQQATLGMGDPFLFDSIAAVVIGGTSILGGRGNYWGSIAGAIFLVVLRAVLQQYNISEAGRSIVTGVVILVALLLYGREAREV